MVQAVDGVEELRVGLDRAGSIAAGLDELRLAKLMDPKDIPLVGSYDGYYGASRPFAPVNSVDLTLGDDDMPTTTTCSTPTAASSAARRARSASSRPASTR